MTLYDDAAPVAISAADLGVRYNLRFNRKTTLPEIFATWPSF